MPKYSQRQQVIDTMRQQGGYATLGNLYHLVDTTTWGTKTPNESIRRIVQQSKEIFKIKPGLWALEDCRKEVLAKFNIDEKDASSEDVFTHSYFQGLIVEIGNMRNYTTFVPAQDQHRLFLEKPLVEVCNTIEVPNFSFPEQTNRAKTIDVIWFNSRNMPDSFFEVEHTTDIQNSVTKFCDLQDFNSRFIIVAPENRHDQFEKVMNRTAFKQIRSRVSFTNYDTISKQYSLMCQEMALKGRI